MLMLVAVAIVVVVAASATAEYTSTSSADIESPNISTAQFAMDGQVIQVQPFQGLVSRFSRCV